MWHILPMENRFQATVSCPVSKQFHAQRQLRFCAGCIAISMPSFLPYVWCLFSYPVSQHSFRPRFQTRFHA